MAIFAKKTNTGKKTASAKPAAAPVSQHAAIGVGRDLTHILKHARITEKASMHQSAGVYTFDIAESATKRDVIAAVRTLYKAEPIKVAVVPVRSKTRRSMRTGKAGVKRGGKKAYVYLKKGETITLS